MPREIRLFNTLTRAIESLRPLDDDHVRLYVCGPTVYDFSHIGNLRTFLFTDVLRRSLVAFGYRVTEVMNLTDIDDKTISGAVRDGVSLREYTDRYVAAFFEDLDTLHVERAEHYPRATEYIPAMTALVERLQADGHTYEQDGSVYFRISSFPGYGRLSRVDPSNIRSGLRVDADEYEKEDVRDFVLWKRSREGEPSWPTPFGPGRPGWHLECSTMAMDLLGESIDIHVGGVDLVFPHHENEIAQSEAASGTTFAHTWLHAEHLVVEGEKMSKSKGNFFTLRDLLERGHDPLGIRYLLISVPYRQKLNFTFDALAGAETVVERIGNTLRRLRHAPIAEAGGDLNEDTPRSFIDEFDAALADDLNTARALAALHGLLTSVNHALDGGGIGVGPRNELDSALAHADAVLGILPESGQTPGIDSAEIAALIERRALARETRDFARADAIRDDLLARGVVLEDTPHGTIWHVRR